MAVERWNPEEDDGRPPRLMVVDLTVSPGNDPDRVDQVMEALDAAYVELRQLMSRQANVADPTVRAFWTGNIGHAFKVTVGISSIDPEAPPESES